MAVREDCRHYSARTIRGNERVERCRLSVNLEDPFACPDDCLFFEPRSGMTAGWTVTDEPSDPT